MKKLTWKNETRKVKDLIPADYNPRSLNETQRQNLEDSIREFDAVMPVVVNIGSRDNVLIGGHQRTTIYADLGIEEIDVRVPNRELDEEEEQRLNLRLNKNTGGWDIEKLGTMDLDMLVDIGFGEEELSGFWDNVDIIDDRAMKPANPKKPDEIIIAPGEMYQLGRHRVTTGELVNLDLLMDGEQAQAIFMDPQGVKKVDPQKELIGEAMAYAHKDCHIFYWTKEEMIPTIATLLGDHKAKMETMMLWIKPETINTKTAFNRCYEPCIYATKGKPYLSKDHKGVNEILNQDITEGARVVDDLLQSLNLYVTERDFSEDNRPVSLHEKPIKRCTQPGDIVLDTNGDTGTLLLALETLGRSGRIHHEDPAGASKIIRRWEAYTGTKAKKL